MSRSSKRLPKVLLAAPFVVTAAFAQACSPPANPEVPVEPPTNPPMPTATEPPPTATVGVLPTATEAPPTATVAVPPTAAPVATDLLGPGQVVKDADGTCSFHFDPQQVRCPPGASCNPGPPRMPVKVKCPPDKQ